MAKRVLLVDDEQQLRYSLAEFLSRMGFEITPAESGAQALSLLVTNPPDVVVSDIMMDDMDGFELQRRVRALTGHSIPFIFVTAKSDLKDRLEGLRSGADDYVTKPFAPEELGARIEALLNRVEQTRREERRELENLRARLLNEVAAQLRAPVANVVDKLSTVLGERFGANEVEKQRYLRQALEDADGLRQVIEDLAWSSADLDSHATLELQPTRIAPLVRAAAATAARLAETRGVSLTISCGGLLSGVVDGAAMTRALAGLLEAVVAVAPKHSQVQLSATRSSDGGIEFIVADSGASAATSPQADGSTAAANALALAQHIVEGHRGRLTIRSEEGGVCSYLIWIPGRMVRHGGHRE